MTNTKGMSQTLALIVAASVLMMTALTVIFLAQGSLGNFGSNAGKQACLNAVRSQCNTHRATQDSEGIYDTPSACLNSEGELISAITSNDKDGQIYQLSDSQVTCKASGSGGTTGGP